MILIETCPICGNDLVDMCYPTYPPQYGKECFQCGWKSDLVKKEEIVRVPYNGSKTAEVLSEHFVIPCDLCNKYFRKDGSCPTEVEKCNSMEHWNMLLERIAHEKQN